MVKRKKEGGADSLISRLEQLNRGTLKNPPKFDESNSSQPDIYGKEKIINEPVLRLKGDKAEYISIEEAVPGQVTEEEDGEFLLIKQRLRDLQPSAGNTIKEFPLKLKAILNKASSYSEDSEVRMLAGVHPSKILFLDIETCGLSGVPLFLIGVSYFTGEDFSFLQLFARNYYEEKPLLSFFNRLFSQYDLLVTYNGKSFDLPFIISRGHVNKVRIPETISHLDLLMQVRKYWKNRLPNCKLQTVERHIFDRSRSGDIPGSQIPQVYSEFVQTGNAKMAQEILKHNVLDIITMIDIVMKLYSDTGRTHI